MQNMYERYRYELIAAFAGGIVMVLELVGARMVAPYFGTSIYVWTAMIGVILGALALGYSYGGKWADLRANDRGLTLILVAAAIIIFVSIAIQESILRSIAATPVDIRVQTLVAVSILFGPASFFLGVVSPYVVKLRLSSLSTAGYSVGRLYAAGTIGSIAGTFLAGYFLIDWFGNRTLGFSLVVLLLAVSFMGIAQRWWWQRLGVMVGVVIFMALPAPQSHHLTADIDSAYARYQVVTHERGPETVRSLVTDRFGTQSAIVLGRPDVAVFDYVARFRDSFHRFRPERSLVIGGGTYTFPVMAARMDPDATVTAVEIDPKLTEVAKDYFELAVPANLTIAHADGRIFLNRTQERYDAIYVDAFSSLTPPFHLATVEATARMKAALSPSGVVVVNVIAARDASEYLAAVMTTSRQVFRSVEVYPAGFHRNDTERQNLIVVMTDNDSSQRAISDSLPLPAFSVPDVGRVLTDDHAPIEQLIAR